MRNRKNFLVKLLAGVTHYDVRRQQEFNEICSQNPTFQICSKALI